MQLVSSWMLRASHSEIGTAPVGKITARLRSTPTSQTLSLSRKMITATSVEGTYTRRGARPTVLMYKMSTGILFEGEARAF
jgi:hypothetical protein